mmetsp:Transcript_13519/g.37461  ORF Transcript_13519/g.37461 Transcript_13519/m.37461 type:complete len:96 (+) Transcript_13519:238-525(+)
MIAEAPQSLCRYFILLTKQSPLLACAATSTSTTNAAACYWRGQRHLESFRPRITQLQKTWAKSLGSTREKDSIGLRPKGLHWNEPVDPENAKDLL